MVTIRILNPVESCLDVKSAQLILPAVSWKAEYWRDQRVSAKRLIKKAEAYTADAFYRKERKGGLWYLHTGLIPRIAKYCHARNLKLRVEIPQELKVKIKGKPRVPGINFRTDQIKMLKSMIKSARGVVKAPTGTGKTILQLGILSILKDMGPCLLLADSSSIITQTAKEMKKFGFKDVVQIGAGEKYTGKLHDGITVATRQSFSKIDPEETSDHFVAVLVDETHHVSSIKGQYGQILSTLLAPIRLGFTATLPTKESAVFAMEGLLGPVIEEQTIQEAVGTGVLATPTIRLVKGHQNQNMLRELRSYNTVYDAAITDNRRRNHQIMMITKEYVEQGKTVLLMIRKLKHGRSLQAMGRALKLDPKFVRGSTEASTREIVKNKLADKDISVVIASAVWREGVNIPSLDVVINACGGKSEIMTLQAIGRGLRKTKEKDKVIIVDFFDPYHHYLVAHFGERIVLYMDNKWL